MELDAASHRLFGKDLGRLAAALADAPALRALDLRDNWLGDGGAEQLAGVLPATSLRRLDLSGNKVGPAGAAAVEAALRAGATLQSLTLRDNQLGAEGATS